MIQQKRVYKKDRAHSTIKLSTKSDMTVKVKDHSKGDDLYMKINKISKSFIKKKKFTTPRQRIRKRRLANRSTSASNKNGMSLTGLQFKRKRKPKPKRVGSAKEYKFNFKKFIKYGKRKQKLLKLTKAANPGAKKR